MLVVMKHICTCHGEVGSRFQKIRTFPIPKMKPRSHAEFILRPILPMPRRVALTGFACLPGSSFPFHPAGLFTGQAPHYSAIQPLTAAHIPTESRRRDCRVDVPEVVGCPLLAPLLLTQDAGQEPPRGGPLYTRYGNRIYVDNACALYRQLPKAYREPVEFFTNLVSLSKLP